MALIRQFLKDLRTPLYKNAIYLMVNTIIASGLGFFFWMVVTRYYPPNDVGLAAVIIQVVLMIGFLSTLGLGEGLVRFLPSSGEKSEAMINSSLTVSGLAAILFSLAFLMGLDIWSPSLLFIRNNWFYLLSFVLFAVVFALYPIMNQVLIAGRNAKLVLAGTSVTGVRILLPVVFVSLFGAYGVFASWSVAMFIALLVGILLFVPMVNPGYRPFPAVKWNVLSGMIRFSAANYVGGIFIIMPASLLPLVIANTLEVEYVAYYYVAFTIASFLFAITYATCSSLFAEGSHFERELTKNARKALKLLFALLIPAVIVVFLFGEHLLLLFGSDYSSEGLVLLRVFALSSIFVGLNGVFLATRVVLKRLKPVIAIDAFIAFSTIGMGYALLLSMGLVGIAISWTLGQGIVSVAIGIYLLRERLRKNK